MVDLRKLHLQFKKASQTQMEIDLEAAEVSDNSLQLLIHDIVHSCKCQLSFCTPLHPVSSVRVLSDEEKIHLQIDVTSIGGNRFMHSVDRVTDWSEVGFLCRRELVEQVRIFCCIKIYRHGTPRTILSDGEYFKGEFKAFCENSSIVLITVAAHAHE